MLQFFKIHSNMRTNQNHIVLLAVTLLASSTQVQAQVEGGWMRVQQMQAGAAVLVPELQGQYVYRPQSVRSQEQQLKPFFAVGSARQEESLYSAEEEFALWGLHEKTARESQEKRPSIPKMRMAMNWPKVLVKGEEVCVPRAQQADTPHWREHLVCTTLNRKQP